MIWIFVVFFVIFLFIISLYIRIYTTFHFYLENDKSFFKIKVRILGINVFNRDILLTDDENPDKKKQVDNYQKSPESFLEAIKKNKQMIQQLLQVKPLIRKLLLYIRVYQFSWITRFGTGDASHTGILAGGLWAIKGSIVGLMVDHLRVLKRPSVEVIPLFQHQYFYTECKCMLSIRLGQTILAFLRIMKHIKANKTRWNKTTA